MKVAKAKESWDVVLLCDVTFQSVVDQIPCDQGDSRNMSWRFERFNKISKMGSVFREGLNRKKNDIAVFLKIGQ